MIDGNWHNLTSLWRTAKKHRPIGLVGVGMTLNQLQESLGRAVFDVETNPVDDPAAQADIESAWKIKDEYIGIMRAVLSSMDGGQTIASQAISLNSALQRSQLQQLTREQVKHE